ANRWWIYQRERFPVVVHGMLIAALCAGVLLFSAKARGNPDLPGLRTCAAAFVSVFLFFLQLRIADEFKDYQDDLKYRPYRPVPRGLVRLSELGRLGLASAAVQLGLALWLNPRMILPLVLVWAYMVLMSKEFFVATWLKSHPLAYLASHMVIMPLIYFYIAACDWWAAGGAMPRGLVWLLAAGFFTGTVVEFGRKIRAPHDEEPGVETYSALWGRRRAIRAWLAASALASLFILVAAGRNQFAVPMAVLLAVLLACEAASARRFLRSPARGSGKRIDRISGISTLLLHLGMGAVIAVGG
ncbi:MAG TPA: UbiA family prenyltransferase, partial [Syntrophobacteria bacterium]|nr:UbiA family prenyltransferase [Syntrophobacteria bacterium]